MKAPSPDGPSALCKTGDIFFFASFTIINEMMQLKQTQNMHVMTGPRTRDAIHLNMAVSIYCINIAVSYIIICTYYN